MLRKDEMWTFFGPILAHFSLKMLVAWRDDPNIDCDYLAMSTKQIW